MTTLEPNHWVYLVNDRDENWGYFRSDGSLVPVLDFFLGEQRDLGTRSRRDWTLSRIQRDFRKDDVIWIRAAKPLGAFIGCGVVAARLKPSKGGVGYVFRVKWDDALCRLMATDPITGVLEKHTQSVRKLTESELKTLLKAVGRTRSFTPAGDDPAPHEVVKRLQAVTARQGQAVFRARLRMAYGGCCAMTDTIVEQVLQAAHIWGYAVSGDNAIRNGLLLRPDVHDLFDRGLVWVTESLTIGVAPTLKSSEYGALAGKRLRLPKDSKHHPDPERLRQHRTQLARRPR